MTWTPRSLRVLSCYIPASDFPETLDEVNSLLDILDPHFLKLERLLIHDREDRMRFLNCTLSKRGVRTITGYLEGTTHHRRKTLKVRREQAFSAIRTRTLSEDIQNSTISALHPVAPASPTPAMPGIHVDYHTFAPRAPAPVDRREVSSRSQAYIDLVIGLISLSWFAFFVLYIAPMFCHWDTM